MNIFRFLMLNLLIIHLGTGSLFLLPQALGQEKPEDYLKTPRCGSFGPTEELMSNPGVLWTYMAGGSASHILYPYLAGCTPAELRDQKFENDPKVKDIQGFFFNADGKSTGGYWRRGDFSENHFFTVNFMQFDPKGYLTFQGYSCSKGFAFDSEAVPSDSTWKKGGEGVIDAWETSSHRYDDQRRMVFRQYYLPADCFGPEKEKLIKMYYTYEGKSFPQLPTRTVFEFVKPEARTVTFDIEYITENDRITKVRRKYSGGNLQEDTYFYNDKGKVIKAIKWFADAEKNPVMVEYTYDGEGRLLTMDREDGFKFKFTYRPDGQLEGLLSPTPHYRKGVPKNKTFVAFTPSYGQ